MRFATAHRSFLLGAFTATPAIIAALLNPGALTLILILGAIGYCRWWLFGRLVCLGGNQ